jgi:glyoxylase I family protein
MFKRIDHVELVTDNPDRTIAFYTDILGFSVKARDRVERSGAGVPINLTYLQLGDTTVEIIFYDGAQPSPAPTGIHLGYNLIALEVEDMGKAIDFLKSKGVPVVWGPMVRPGQTARAEITDPNGYHIELRQWF